MFLEFFLPKFSHLATNQMGRPLFYFVWYTMSSSIFNKLSKIYYSPQGYWKGFAAIKKLAKAAKVSEDVAQNWLMKQALGRFIYQPHVTFQDRNLMFLFQTKFTMPIFCISHTIAHHAPVKLLNMLSQW